MMKKIIFMLLLFQSTACADPEIFKDVLTLRQTVATAGTEVRLSSTSITAKRIIVQAETDNTGLIAVGDSNVVAAVGTQRGTILFAGDSMTVRANDLMNVWIDSTVNGDGVTVTYYQ